MHVPRPHGGHSNSWSAIALFVCGVLITYSISALADVEDRISKGPQQLPKNETDSDTKPGSDIIHNSHKGWDFLVNKLLQDGVPQAAVDAVFASPDFPQFSFVPYRLNPRETVEMYARMTAIPRLDRAQSFLDNYAETFKVVEAKFGVSRFIIAAVISIETNWGTFTGNEIVFYRLARVVSTGEPKNLELNFKKFKEEDPAVTFEQAQARSEYLYKTFYPHLLALFHSYADNPAEILKLKGSIAGAFGLPQFLPKSLDSYGLDGNGDGRINLFEVEDAIYSVANFLKAHGWKRLLDPQEKLKVLWHYNRSDAYGRAVIRVALSLQNKILKLDG